MVEFLCLAGMLFGSFWGSAYFQDAGSTPGHLDSTPRYLRQLPQVVPPAEPYQPPTELKSLDDAAKKIDNASTSGKAVIGPRDSKRTPVPAQPRIAEALEERFKPGDSRVPILPPIAPGQKPACDDPPTPAEILGALPRPERGIPHIYEVYRDDIEFAVEKLVDRVDPPCFFPLIGLAQLHHCHWKCSVSFTETVESSCPFPFRMQNRRTELVYIDKDRLRLCMASNCDDAPRANPASCPGGRLAQKEVPKHAARSRSDQKMHLDVTMVAINRSALPNMNFRWAKNQSRPAGAEIPFRVLNNKDSFVELLQARRDGLAQIIMQPRMVALNGQQATAAARTKVPVITSTGGTASVSYKLIGTSVTIVPIVQVNGQIHLEVCPEITTLDPASSTGVIKHSARVKGEVEFGQTLAIGGLTYPEVTAMRVRVPLLVNLTPVGSVEAWKQPQITKQEIVILVTPRLWDAPPPVGPASRAGPAVPLGWVPLGSRDHLRVSGSSIVQAVHDQECPKTLPVCPPAKADRNAPMSVNDVVRMSQKGISEGIILRQMELTNAVFNLTVDDIIELHDQGVAEKIIRAMQERREPASAKTSRAKP
jgi:hypothetical protein